MLITERSEPSLSQPILRQECATPQLSQNFTKGYKNLRTMENPRTGLLCHRTKYSNSINHRQVSFYLFIFVKIRHLHDQTRFS